MQRPSMSNLFPMLNDRALEQTLRSSAPTENAIAAVSDVRFLGSIRGLSQNATYGESNAEIA
jgi:hypothetical protein